MGRKAKIENAILDAEILNLKNEIISEDGKNIAGTKNQVWHKIATIVNSKFDTEVTAASIRVRVALNRGGIKEKLGLLPLIEKSNPTQDKASGDDNYTSDENESTADVINFTLTLSSEEWTSISPQSKLYCGEKRTRYYEVLAPFNWSNVVHDHFFLHTKLPCSITYKRASVRPSGNIYVSVHGKCTECGSIFYGEIKDVPSANTRVLMNCTYTGSFKTNHYKKRKLAGSEKERSLDAMLNQHIAPSVYRRNEANRLMVEGDSMPPQIPSLASLRLAKHRAVSSLRHHQDPINALGVMKQIHKYDGAIRDIGFDKFFVHFWTNLQMKIYKEQCTKCAVPTVSFDATGGVCKKIKKYVNNYCSSIFLYEGIMKVEDQSFTVTSMLSEQHDNISISLWLKRWLQCGLKPPKVSITDQSLALMSATVQAFTQYDSLEKYLKICFLLCRGDKDVEIPTCFIRNDVNHFVHLITQWKPLKSSRHQRTKQLFVRSIALLITCDSMKNAEQILEAIFIVAMSKYDGQIISNVDTPKQDTQCSQSKKFLQSLISSNSANIDSFINESENNIEEQQTLEFDSLDSFDALNSFKDWSKLLASKCEEKIGDIEGEFDNAQYIPEIVPIIINTMKLFPCWSNIMVNVFKYGDNIASSSRIESNFNNIKNRVFKNDNLPIRVDDFVERLVEFYRGDHLILQAKESKKSTEVLLINDYSEPICSPLSSDELYTTFNKPSQNTLAPCIACKNGDFPTGLHRCSKCNKAVHIFAGCSVEDPLSEEGCGEKRICLACNKINELDEEKNSIENWKKKGSMLSSKTRSMKSYLVKQPGFEHIDLNNTKTSNEIALLRNGSCFQNRPVYVPGYNKVLLTNTCSADSLLSILAVSVAESENYRKSFTEGDKGNIVEFVKKMIGNRPTKEIYRDRVYLLVLHFITESQNLVGGIMLINTVDTAASMCEKLLENMPSYTRFDRCQNNICLEEEISLAGKVVITLLGVDGNIDLQKEMDKFFQPYTKLCVAFNCNCSREVVTKPTDHIIVELLSIPKDFRASGKYFYLESATKISQNYAGKVLLKLGDISKTITVHDDVYNLSGVIAFDGSARELRQSYGHYIAYALRSNGQWQCYDDLKEQVSSK